MKKRNLKPKPEKKAKKKAPPRPLPPQLTPFEQYSQSLPEADQKELALFFADLSSHVMLARAEKLKIRADFENALLYYAAAGLPFRTALERLEIANLGGFYARPAILWYALDDAAKIYPLSMKHGQMSVFRLSVYFKENVVPELLQMALTFTIKRFPSFATTVKKGVFWHYLDTAKRRYTVEPESGMPCRPLQISRSGSQSFRVEYHEKRLSVEYFHILTDGSGGMTFLKTLTAEYLRLLGVEPSQAEGVLNINDLPTKSETANEFWRAHKTETISGFVDKPALQMSGRSSRTKPCRVLHFKMDASSLKQAAQAKNATITAYLLAQLFVAGKSATDEQTGEISIQVPVNMRKFYPVDTVRNFSMYCGIRLPIAEITEAEAIIAEISQQLTEKTSQQNMSEMMASTEHMVSMMRYIPLFIKAPAAKVIYGFLGDKIFSNTLSNLGVVKMPGQMAAHIDCMDFVLGTSITNRAGCALVTFGNTAMLSISKMTADPSFEEKLYSLLLADGITPIVEGSEPYES